MVVTVWYVPYKKESASICIRKPPTFSVCCRARFFYSIDNSPQLKVNPRSVSPTLGPMPSEFGTDNTVKAR